MSNKTILIVEDEMITTMLYKYLINNEGFEIAGIVSTGEDAISVTKEESPDLILMDIQLGTKMDGVDAMVEIRKISVVPVIYITSNSDSITKERAMQTLPHGFLNKPVLSSELAELLHNILD